MWTPVLVRVKYVVDRLLPRIECSSSSGLLVLSERASGGRTTIPHRTGNRLKLASSWGGLATTPDGTAGLDSLLRYSQSRTLEKVFVEGTMPSPKPARMIFAPRNETLCEYRKKCGIRYPNLSMRRLGLHKPLTCGVTASTLRYDNL